MGSPSAVKRNGAAEFDPVDDVGGFVERDAAGAVQERGTAGPLRRWATEAESARLSVMIIGLSVRLASRRQKSMGTKTYEGFVTNGQIRLKNDIQLTENSRVFVLIPDEEDIPKARILSPRLVNLDQVKDFILEVSEEASDAGV